MLTSVNEGANIRVAKEVTTITIREIRILKLDWSAKKMAEFLGISRQAYWKKEKGLTRFSTKEFLNICKEAGVNPLEVNI